MKLNRILIPTNFSSNTEAAIEFAKKVIDPKHGKIDLMTVVSGQFYFTNKNERLDLPSFKGAGVYPITMEKTYDRLENLAKEHLAEEHIGKMHVWIGKTVHDPIVEQGSNGKYDLVVMSNRAADNPKLIGGLVAAKVFRHSTVPVIAVAEKTDVQTMKNIMVPLDMSQLSYQAIPMAFNLASAMRAKITFFHTIDLYDADTNLLPYKDPFRFNDKLYKNMIERVAEYLDYNQHHNLAFVKGKDHSSDLLVHIENGITRMVDVQSVINQGAGAHYEIINYADKSADLIVMTSVGSCDFARPFMGTTAEEVLEFVKTPVVMVWPNETIRYELDYNWNTESAYEDSLEEEYDDGYDYKLVAI